MHAEQACEQTVSCMEPNGTERFQSELGIFLMEELSDASSNSSAGQD